MKPKFDHDCTKCVFLGHWEDADLYACPSQNTVIARFSSDAADYKAGLVFTATDPHLAIAFARAHQVNIQLAFTSFRELCEIQRYPNSRQ